MPSSSSRKLDPYKVLGIPPNATREEIRAAYRKLALKHHPDKVQGDAKAKADANAKFAEIGAAYETLTRGGSEDDDNVQEVYTDFARGGFAPDVFDHFAHPFFYGGGGGSPFTSPFFGSFSDPFELFRRTFEQDFFTDFDRPPASMPMMMDPMASLFDSLERGGMGGGGGGNQFFSSFSSSSGGRISGGGGGGVMKSVSTSTQIINGKRTTRTETTIVHPDGRRETKVEVSGDDDAQQNRICNDTTQLLEGAPSHSRRYLPESSTSSTSPPSKQQKKEKRVAGAKNSRTQSNDDDGDCDDNQSCPTSSPPSRKRRCLPTGCFDESAQTRNYENELQQFAHANSIDFNNTVGYNSAFNHHIPSNPLDFQNMLSPANLLHHHHHHGSNTIHTNPFTAFPTNMYNTLPGHYPNNDIRYSSPENLQNNANVSNIMGSTTTASNTGRDNGKRHHSKKEAKTENYAKQQKEK